MTSKEDFTREAGERIEFWLKGLGVSIYRPALSLVSTTAADAVWELLEPRLLAAERLAESVDALPMIGIRGRTPSGPDGEFLPVVNITIDAGKWDALWAALLAWKEAGK
jgi:hypothetical protein